MSVSITARLLSGWWCRTHRQHAQYDPDVTPAQPVPCRDLSRQGTVQRRTVRSVRKNVSFLRTVDGRAAGSPPRLPDHQQSNPPDPSR